MVAAAVIIALICALVVTLAVIATVKAVRTVKNGVDQAVTQARRTVEDTRLKARQFTQAGPAGEVAELRLLLRTSMRATQEVLREGLKDDPSLTESLALFDRLSAHGRELDDDLRKLESEPDRERLAACLPDLRERTKQVTHSADSLRFAAQDRARQFADDELSLLSEQIRMETGALRHWEADAGPGTNAGAEPKAKPAAGSAGTAGSTGSAGAAGSAAGPERPAISGRDGSRQWGYTWEKVKHPESPA
ncbi:hypothetical protein [Streptomyces sp. UNOB3_S3]|uniref:hypothetical protein n=1 Tax=Streptomyces sp. UNOB3_S3 TaxID=2871682 RepID=UPI001E48D039|nr:hypothetical protein [Streptomyces sp. UNOB3_S3]MCC3776200.1 hypothetical protein [Streptomyces sp. UNOB3_S3]